MHYCILSSMLLPLRPASMCTQTQTQTQMQTQTQTQNKTDHAIFNHCAQMYPQTQTQLLRKRNEWLSERFLAFTQVCGHLIWH